MTSLFCIMCCGSAVKHPSDYDVTDRLSWDAVNAAFDERGVILQSLDGTAPAMIRTRALGLFRNRVYKLSIRVRVLGEPTNNVHADLYLGEEYDGPDQELVVPANALGTATRRFERLLNSGSFDEIPFLRVFTFSQRPVLIEEITFEEAS